MLPSRVHCRPNSSGHIWSCSEVQRGCVWPVQPSEHLLRLLEGLRNVLLSQSVCVCVLKTRSTFFRPSRDFRRHSECEEAAGSLSRPQNTSRCNWRGKLQRFYVGQWMAAAPKQTWHPRVFLPLESPGTQVSIQ